MKHFMIWPILVPAIAFCHDESLYAGSSVSNQDLVSSKVETPTGSWNTSDFDDVLQQPDPPQSLTVDGTITDYDGYDLYNDDCDNMNDE